MSDALSAPHAATAPKGGLKHVPFPLESYEHPSVPLSAKRLLNFFAEQQPSDARTQVALVPSPGLSLEYTLGTGPVHAMSDELPGRVYVVSGTHFYRMTPVVLGTPGAPFIVDDLGDIGTPDTATIPAYDSMYTIACSQIAAVVCCPPNAFTCSHVPGEPLNQIGGDFPGGKTVAFHDGYFVFSSFENSARFFISRLLDPTDYDALDFAYTDALPNVLVRVIAHRTDVWMMGAAGIEIWYDSGDADFPYRRRAGGVIPFGIATPKTLAKGDNSVWWVTPDHLVMRSNGYQPARVSTHAIEEILRELNSFNGVSGFCYTDVGHTFYVLNLPTSTLVYDSATQKWHDRASEGAGRWRANAVVGVPGQIWFGDSQSGKVLRSENNTVNAGLEELQPITRQIVFPPLWADGARAFCSRVEVEMESGDGRLTDGQVTLDWSDDGGFIWNGGPRVMTASLVEYNRRQRVFTTRLGSFRQRVFRLTVRGAVTIYAMDADISPGAS